GVGTLHRYRHKGSIGRDSEPDPGAVLPIELAANAASLGATAVKVKTVAELRSALEEAKRANRISVICIEVDRYQGVPDYESWWDVPVAEVATVDAVKAARKGYEDSKKNERTYLYEEGSVMATTYPDVIPMIAYENGPAAMDWLVAASGFKERTRMLGADGRLSHGEMEAGQGLIMLATPTPDYQGPRRHRAGCEPAT